uniref:Polycomb group ring finger 3 n=1 Tax=Anas platyrhynchos platyrhynchos TaxID=8840 RepID=A0A493TCH7_ANAPP
MVFFFLGLILAPTRSLGVPKRKRNVPLKKKIIKRYKKARGAGCPGRPPPVWSVGARLLPQLGRFLEVSKKCVLASFLPPAGKSMCPRSQPPRNLRFVGPAGLEGSCGRVSAGCLQAALRGCPPAWHRGAQLGGEETPKMLTRKIKLWDINAHITCRLCNGYLIDATTVTECLHTFCRSCLVKYLEENNTCPTCRIVIHQSHPLQYIGHDRTMQDIVYKLVPGLQEAEMKKQREFYHKLGMEVPGDIKGETCSAKQHLDSHRNGETKTDENSNKETSEEKQEEDNDYHRSDEQVSICLECNSSKLRGLKRKWIRCSAQATVLHLKKFIAKKLNLSSFNETVLGIMGRTYGESWTYYAMKRFLARTTHSSL